jgi:uncharacterized repeat protein (TIGR03803 family)
VLYSFTNGNDGGYPYADLIMDGAGNLYGTTFEGGSSGYAGTVFALGLANKFSSFTAKLQISSTGFDLKGGFTQGAGGQTIDPVTQPLSLTIGTYQVPVPAGSFHQTRQGTYVFEGTINGVALQFRLVQTGQQTWTIQAEGSGVDLSALQNPVTVTLTIGNSTGTTQVNAQH